MKKDKEMVTDAYSKIDQMAIWVDQELLPDIYNARDLQQDAQNMYESQCGEEAMSDAAEKAEAFERCAALAEQVVPLLTELFSELDELRENAATL